MAGAALATKMSLKRSKGAMAGFSINLPGDHD